MDADTLLSSLLYGFAGGDLMMRLAGGVAVLVPGETCSGALG